MVDKNAGIFVSVVILIAIISMVAWIVLGGENGFKQGMLALVTVLVISCPCALGLATPTAITAGVGNAVNGILIKDAESLELAKKLMLFCWIKLAPSPKENLKWRPLPGKMALRR